VTDVIFEVEENRKAAFTLDRKGFIDVLDWEMFRRNCSGDPARAKRHDGRKAE